MRGGTRHETDKIHAHRVRYPVGIALRHSATMEVIQVKHFLVPAQIAMPPLPSLDAVAALAVDSVSSPRSKKSYADILKKFMAWYQLEAEPISRRLVQRYKAEMEAKHLSPSTINVRLAAVKKLVREAQENGFISHEVCAAIERIPGAIKTGSSVGNWLSADQMNAMLALTRGDTVQGRRDRAIFALLVGGWLRREEATMVTCDMIVLREGRPVILDLTRKRRRIQTVAIPQWAYEWLQAWMVDIGGKGRVLRQVNCNRVASAMMGVNGVYQVTKKYAKLIGQNISPHDLRRSCARLSVTGGASLQQVQLQMGHSSITTTMSYVGAMTDLIDTGCDHVTLDVK